MYAHGRDMRSLAALSSRFLVRSESKYDRSQRLLAWLNCSERAEFEDDFAVSLAFCILYSIKYITRRTCPF